MHRSRLVTLGFLSFCACMVTQGAELLNTGYTFAGSESLQMGRINRTGVPSKWSTAKAFPGNLNPTTTYGVKVFTLIPGEAQYIQVNFSDPNAAFFAAAFLDTYTVTGGTGGNGFLGDQGGTGNLGGNPGYFQVFVPFGHTLSIVVNEVTTGGGLGRAFNLQVEGFGDTQFSPPFALGPDLTVNVSHAGSFVVGGSANYAIVVTNAGTAPSAATITLVDVLPSTMTALNLTGNGWNCDLGSLTCTTDAALSPGASAAPVTLTAMVPATGVGLILINTVTLSGGGDQVSSNNFAGDVATITQGRTSKPHGPIVRD